MSQAKVAHTIRNILTQCNSTTITIAQLEGHFLSIKQFAVLAECADILEDLEAIADIDTPTSTEITDATTEEDQVKARRLQVTREIKFKQVQLIASPPGDRSSVNIEIGKLLSERARLDKLIKQLES